MRTLLVIDDEPGHRLMVRAVMEDDGWRVEEASCAEEALDALRRCRGPRCPSVALLDMRLPGMDGMEALAQLLAVRPNLPVVMLTAFGTVGSAVEAMKRGAFDYLTKPADNEELKTVLAKAHGYGQLLRQNTELRRKANDASAEARFIGDSRAMRQVRELCAQVGPTEASVLILGESGTGKELVAEMIHEMSPRSAHPLVKVNCAALPGELLESELFGYVKGAFTGAVKDKPGRFQLAHGGTLFLDEVGELPLGLQAKLLRALQERVVEPLGSVRPVPTDVRIVAATNRDLRAEAQKGAFREDVYFRLAVLEISIAPLRERLEDLAQLTSHLLVKLGRKNKKTVRAVSPAFLDALTAYSWPGNVRELENVLERAIILSRSDLLEPVTLPPHLVGAGREPRQAGAPPGAGVSAGSVPADNTFQSGTVSFEEAERQALVQALEANESHRERTAQALGVSRRTLQYKLKRYGLAKR